MKRILVAAIFSAFPWLAHAEMGLFVGVTYQFTDKGGLGFTVKALNTRQEDKAVAAVGTSFFPGAPHQRFGLDVSLGYQGSNIAALVGYDLLNQRPNLSGGWSDTRK
jgi:hypothetical protein